MFPLPNTNTLEISLDIDLKTARSIDIDFTGAPAEQMIFKDSSFEMTGVNAPFSFPDGKRRVHSRIFFDRSVLEVFVNNSLCATKVIQPLGQWTGLSIKSSGGQAKARLIEAWPMKTMW